MRTIRVFGDQLHRSIGALSSARPGDDRLLLVESEAAFSRPFHRQRVHLVRTAMRRFAAEMAGAGFAVDHRVAPTMAAGLAAHRQRHRPDRVVATEPNKRSMRRVLKGLGVQTVQSDQFL